MNRAAIIKSIDEHASEFNLKRTTIGQMAVRNHRLYANLKAGSDIQIGTVERLLDWLAADAARRSAVAPVSGAGLLMSRTSTQTTASGSTQDSQKLGGAA